MDLRQFWRTTSNIYERVLRRRAGKKIHRGREEGIETKGGESATGEEGQTDRD